MGVIHCNWLTFLTNLVELKLLYCRNCHDLPPLHHLSSLEKLTLSVLPPLKYVSDGLEDLFFTSSAPSIMSFFQSIGELTISNCDHLQGWRPSTRGYTDDKGKIVGSIIEN